MKVANNLLWREVIAKSKISDLELIGKNSRFTLLNVT